MFPFKIKKQGPSIPTLYADGGYINYRDALYITSYWGSRVNGPISASKTVANTQHKVS